MQIWRICRARHAATAFSGEGSRLASARWNSRGVAMAYAAQSLSLAVLEVFVHLPTGDRPDDLMSILADVPVDVKVFEHQKRNILAKLSTGWKFSHEETHRVGDEWSLARETLLLPVPSVIVDGEWNVLVNPEHPKAKEIRVIETKAFRFDPRMFRA